MRITFDHAEAETASIETFFFRASRPLRYEAGQFIELTLPHANPDSRGTSRWFTLSSAPSQDLLSVTTRLKENGGSSFKAALRALTPGTELMMSEAMGDFVLPRRIATPLLFVAGGIGITPVHSILQWLIATDEQRPIHVIYGVRREDDIAFLDTFQTAKQFTTIVVSQPSAAWGGERGPINAAMIIGLHQPTDDTLVYVSGPAPMTESLASDLLAAGLRPGQVVRDSFLGYHRM
ncbi:MAG: FAD-dependent oxidoreductase [Candidatus Saccharibacteria bacterium]